MTGLRRRTPSESWPDLPGAIIIGGDHQGLGIARSLGRQGIPVCVIDDERSIAQVSRYVTHRVPRARLDDAHFVETLLSAVDEHGLKEWVVFPTRDETVAALSANRETLRSYLRIPTPAWSTVQTAWDKRATYALAERVGVPSPRTWVLSGPRELETIPDTPPFAVKPAIKEHFLPHTGVKAWRADTSEQLRSLVRQAQQIMPRDEIIVQELVPGGGSDQYAYCALFRHGEPLADMSVRRQRQHPPEFGKASSYVVTVDMPELAELACRVLRAMDYYGLVEVEFKRDARSGELKLLDINARTWGYHTLGPAAGVDFPHLLYRDQIGLPVERATARAGVRWIRLLTDLPVGVVEIRNRNLGLAEYLRTVRAADTGSVFCRDDPLPALAELGLLPYLIAKRGF